MSAHTTPTNDLKILEAREDRDIASCFEVIVQLRSHLIESEFLPRVRAQQEGGYHLHYVSIDGVAAACAGWRVMDKLVSGKTLYVDDLVTSERFRKRGCAEALFDFLKSEGSRLGCEVMTLDSGHQRFDAHRFYMNQGMHITGHHFSVAIDAE